MGALCHSCPRSCVLPLDALGACKARRESEGTVADENYGRITALAVDPIEKKPLARFMAGSRVLSVGSYGCNMRCPWCQNHTIAGAGAQDVAWREVTPAELVAMAVEQRSQDRSMVGIAYTYNEPLVGWEFVRDTAELAMVEGLKNVLVTNGCFDRSVIREVAPLMDAANIDLKAFTEETYRLCGGSLRQVKETIEEVASIPSCHLELTYLVVPGVNDGEEEVGSMARWVASVDPAIDLHVTRFFPAWRFSDREATAVERVYHLAAVARRWLRHVHVGNC